MKDYVKHRKKQQRTSHQRILWVFAGSICIIVMSVAAFVYYEHKQALTVSSIKHKTLLKVATYFPQVFEKKDSKPKKEKKVSGPSTTMKAVHFDFYDELPKAQLGLSQERLQVQKEEVAEKREEQEEQASQPKPHMAKSPGRGSFSLRNIEKDLYEDLAAIKSSAHASSYILQIAIFHHLKSAHRYQAALRAAGLRVEVVRVKQGRELVYRLQQGPYRNMEQVKWAKKQLKERGVTCDVRKLSPYET